jgi:WD40 repeat protein
LVFLVLLIGTISAQSQKPLVDVDLSGAEYSLDGTLIALSGRFADFRGFMVLTGQGEILAQFQTELFISSLAWSPDGQRIAVHQEGEFESILYIYHIKTREPFIIEETSRHQIGYNSGYPIQWSTSGQFLVTYFGLQLTVWGNETNGIVSEIITGDSGWDNIEDVAWHPITNELYVLDSRNGLRVYDPLTGKPTRDTTTLQLSEPQSTESTYLVASELAFNRDGSELAIVFNDFYQTTRFINPATGETLREFRPENPDFDIRTLRWSADDAMVMTVGAPSFAIRFWDAQTGVLLQSHENLLGGYVRDFVVSPDMTQMVAIGGYPTSAGMPSALPVGEDVGLNLVAGYAVLLYLP